MTGTVTEIVHPPVRSLPRWPEQPEPVDVDAASYLVVAIGVDPATAEVARAWVRSAEGIASTALVLIDDPDAPEDRTALDGALAEARTGVRVMVVGGQYDVLRVLTAARDAGLVPAELRSFVTSTTDLPVYCAHCCAVHRVLGAPDDEVTCPGCARLLEVHSHLASALGAFLASDARAGELPAGAA